MLNIPSDFKMFIDIKYFLCTFGLIFVYSFTTLPHLLIPSVGDSNLDTLLLLNGTRGMSAAS